jgi:hypothetical protein
MLLDLQASHADSGVNERVVYTVGRDEISGPEYAPRVEGKKYNFAPRRHIHSLRATCDTVELD